MWTWTARGSDRQSPNANPFPRGSIWTIVGTRVYPFSHSGEKRRKAAQGGIQKRRAEDYLSSALPVCWRFLLERYFERELDLAFRLGSAGKEAEVGIRYSVVGLRRTLKRAKGCLIPGVEEVRSKDDTSLLFAEWKHLFQR